MKNEIIIIGAGFSGAMVAVNLAKKSGEHLKIHLVEKSGKFGRGVAYSTDDLRHLLNVPASNMSALVDEPGHFLQWLAKNEHEAVGTRFYPRKVYGDYIENLLASVGVNRIHAAAVDVEIDNETVSVTLDNGETIKANAAVIALGNFPPVTNDSQRALFQLGSRILHNPWGQKDKLAGIDKASDILIIGTGLTMVDFTTSIFGDDFSGKITAVSRRGLLPEPHIADKPKYNLQLPENVSLNGLLKFFRKEVAKAAEAGIPWQSVFDELRPHTVSLWHKLSVKDKRRFMRHLRVWWDTRRHRMSPEIHKRLKLPQVQGRLAVRAGRICHINPLNDKFEVAWKPRGSNHKLVVESFDYIVNCAAPETDIEETRSKLVQNLLARDYIRPGPLRMGIRTSEKGEVIGSGDYASPYLFTIGPLAKGELWETTAVPELRVQADKLARVILENLELREAALQGAAI